MHHQSHQQQPQKGEKKNKKSTSELTHHRRPPKATSRPTHIAIVITLLTQHTTTTQPDTAHHSLVGHHHARRERRPQGEAPPAPPIDARRVAGVVPGLAQRPALRLGPPLLAVGVVGGEVRVLDGDGAANPPLGVLPFGRQGPVAVEGRERRRRGGVHVGPARGGGGGGGRDALRGPALRAAQVVEGKGVSPLHRRRRRWTLWMEGPTEVRYFDGNYIITENGTPKKKKVKKRRKRQIKTRKKRKKRTQIFLLESLVS